MGRIVVLLIFISANSLSNADFEEDAAIIENRNSKYSIRPMVTQYQRDVIREFHASEILGLAPGSTKMIPEQKTIRKRLRPTFITEKPKEISIDSVKTLRVFNNSPIRIGDLLNVIERSTGYTLFKHKNSNLSQVVTIGEEYYSLNNIIEYLNTVSNYQLDISHEARSISIYPKAGF